MSDVPSSKLGQPFGLESQGLIPQRFAHILEDPRMFAQTFKSQFGAVNGSDQTHGPLEDLLDFLSATVGSRYRKSSRAAKNVFIQEALVDELLKTVLTSRPFWMCEENLYIRPSTISVRIIPAYLFRNLLMHTY